MRVCWHRPSQPAAAVTPVCWNHPHLAGKGLCPGPAELQSGWLAGTARAAGPGSAAAGQRATARGLSESRGAGDVSGTSWVGTAPGHRVPVELHTKAPLETLGRGAAGAAHGGQVTAVAQSHPQQGAVAVPQGRVKAQDSAWSKVSCSPAPARRARRDPQPWGQSCGASGRDREVSA